MNSKRGRPALGKVVYKRRVSPDMVERLDSFLEWPDSDAKPESKMVHVGADRMLSEYKTQNRALLEDVDRLTKELEEEKAKVKRALELDLDEKGKLGWRSYFKLKEGGGKSEFDQS